MWIVILWGPRAQEPSAVKSRGNPGGRRAVFSLPDLGRRPSPCFPVAQMNKRLAHDFQLQASYTLAQVVDDVPDHFTVNLGVDDFDQVFDESDPRAQPRPWCTQAKLVLCPAKPKPQPLKARSKWAETSRMNSCPDTNLKKPESLCPGFASKTPLTIRFVASKSCFSALKSRLRGLKTALNRHSASDIRRSNDQKTLAKFAPHWAFGPHFDTVGTMRSHPSL